MNVRKSIGVAFVLAFVLAALLGGLNLSARPARAAGAAIVNVAFDNPSATVDVSPGSDCIVMLTGYVTCQVPVNTNIQSVQVTLKPDCAWPAAVSPSSYTFSSQEMGKKVQITVSVVAPPQESRGSSQTITVGGEWRTFPGATGGSITGTAQATIQVEQFYKFSIQCAKPFVEVGPGTPVTYNIKINNEGNERDTFALTTDKIPTGWTVQLGSTSIDVDEKKSQVVSVTVTPPQEWNLWKNGVTMIKIKISSKTALTEGLPLIEEYPIYMREKGASAPGFEPLITALALVGAVLIASGGKRLQKASKR